MLSDSGRLAYPTVMLEGEKHRGVPVVIGGDNLPSPVGIGLTDLPNIGWGQWPPWPPQFRNHCIQAVVLQIRVQIHRNFNHRLNKG